MKAIEKWNGVLPQFMGSAIPFIDAKSFRGAATQRIKYPKNKVEK